MATPCGGRQALQRKAAVIASNYRRYAEALALQLPLPFGHALIWNGSRPTTRAGRTMRAVRAAAFKLADRVRYAIAAVVPGWWKEKRARDLKLAKAVRETCLALPI